MHHRILTPSPADNFKSFAIPVSFLVCFFFSLTQSSCRNTRVHYEHCDGDKRAGRAWGWCLLAAVCSIDGGHAKKTSLK